MLLLVRDFDTSAFYFMTRIFFLSFSVAVRIVLYCIVPEILCRADTNASVIVRLAVSYRFLLGNQAPKEQWPFNGLFCIVS